MKLQKIDHQAIVLDHSRTAETVSVEWFSDPCRVSGLYPCRTSGCGGGCEFAVIQGVAPGVMVEEDAEAYFARLGEQGASLPAFAHEEFARYLRCGRLEEGFVRVVCTGCRHEHLVAFSCKCRGFCPSCGARRMVESAAGLVDMVAALENDALVQQAPAIVGRRTASALAHRTDREADT